MPVTTDQIRLILGNPAENVIPGDVIAQAILDAERYVQERTGQSSGATYEMAVRYRAAYTTLIAYWDILVRNVGPRGIESLVERLKMLFDEAMRILGTQPDEATDYSVGYVAMTDSWWDDKWT